MAGKRKEEAGEDERRELGGDDAEAEAGFASLTGTHEGSDRKGDSGSNGGELEVGEGQREEDIEESEGLGADVDAAEEESPAKTRARTEAPSTANKTQAQEIWKESQTK